VVAYKRSFDGKSLLSAWNIIINLVLPFIFSNGERLWDCRFDKYSLGSRGSVSGRRYIPETSIVGWLLLNGQHASQFFINDSFLEAFKAMVFGFLTGGKDSS
jgi:hypothetical protein